MEKYLIIIIIIIVIYQLCCSCIQIDVKETFSNSQSVTGIDDNNAINTLAALAKDLQSPAGVTIPGNLNATILKVSNNLTVKDLQVDGVSNLTPKGGIIAWKPLPANIVGGVLIPPPTWALCDGQNGTPDLRGRFILGNGQGDSHVKGVNLTNRALDTVGGFETVKLDITEIPPHSHGYIRRTVGATTPHGNSYEVARSDWETWQSTGNAGGAADGQAARHENMPPFYVLAYIMKL
jgi:microcystin-dependent protein